MTQEDYNPRNIPEINSGDPIDSSFRAKLNALIRGLNKRTRGALGRESATSASTTEKLHSLRERINVENRSGEDIPVFSVFSPKKSNEINYFWGPPVRTEAFSNEQGFNYFTNYDRAIADGHGSWCELIGELPVRVRYNVSDGVPKIGHLIGPLEDGSMSVKRAGYVVIAEPDVTPIAPAPQTVWAVKSNDHQIRVEIVDDIQPKLRGQVSVQNEELCLGTPGRKDPNQNVPSIPFIIDEVLNLTGVVLNTGNFYYAKPILGIGLCIIGEYDPIFKVQATTCHEPGDTTVFSLYVLDVVSDTFILVPATSVVITDDDSRFMLLPGERADVAIYLDECGDAKFKFIGSYGLTRQAKVGQGIACFAAGSVAILNHGTQVTCTGIVDCAVTACNGQTGEEGRRFLYAEEIVNIHFRESTWKIDPQPIGVSAWAKLSADMCPDDLTGTIDIQTLDVVTYCKGVILGLIPVVVDNTRLGGSGKIGDWVRFDIDFPDAGGTATLWAVNVQHHCKHIVVPEGGCAGNQNPDSGNFIRFDPATCKIEGFVLKSTSQMFCGNEDWEDEIQLINQSVVVDTTLGPGQTCNYDLKYNFVDLCVFDTTPTPIAVPGGSTNFKTATFYDNIDLVYDPGEDPSQGSDPDPCPNPTLILKGRPRAGVVCDDCTEDIDPSAPCPQGTITTLQLTESTAYRRSEITVDSEGRKCVVLFPFSFVTFADCDEGTPDEIICGNPCPPEEQGNEVISP